VRNPAVTMNWKKLFRSLPGFRRRHLAAAPHGEPPRSDILDPVVALRAQMAEMAERAAARDREGDEERCFRRSLAPRYRLEYDQMRHTAINAIRRAGPHP
jgi:hypothetical protein